MKRFLFLFLCFLLFSIMGCGDSASVPTVLPEQEAVCEVNANENPEISEEKQKMESINALDFIKSPIEHNPVFTQEYSADPYAMVYEGRVYLYMTGDEPMYDPSGNLIVNNYSNINTIRVISSDDLVNWTDYGEVFAAGKDGAATWGGNSWAPAACWKMIDGKPRFFLYFANSGNGIAVLTSDSPTGPFTDPIGKALVSRATPTCAEVTWLFDPAVLVDDDGTGYLYFGGGVPSPDKAYNPGTARVARLTDDMIHLDGDPVPIRDVLYLFEDSGINKIGGKYIYSYCSNFNVPEKGCEGYGFGNGEIITMESDNPMGPFTMIGSVLKNPGYFFKNGGNNHHCMFEFNGEWYITYHASLIEEKLGRNTGYRSVNIDKVSLDEDGNIRPIRGTKEGVEQLKDFNPYAETSFVTMSNQAGTEKAPADADAQKYGSGNYNLLVTQDGSWIQISSADFTDSDASKLTVTLKAQNPGSISVRSKYLKSPDNGRLFFEPSDDFKTYEFSLDTPISGVTDIYFVFEGEGTELKSWSFN